MSKLKSRILALILALVTVVSWIPTAGFSADAADVSYNYDGKYIYNWGTRGEVATFLSPNAEKFYDSRSSFEELSAYSGGTSTSTAPNSELYKKLKSLMSGAQTYTTSYAATKELFRYTDCQGGGGKISSFYSGNLIGPSWDGGWNREHTWPNSKGLGGSDEDDIMMLRPTSTSENSSRGNTAYGESGGYYHPNSESGGKYDLRGDVARIFLYVYVRWGNVNGNGSYSTWGSGGVMESLDVMLDWMEADPVDTWELGRNDSVESITGTRNVFVDYPELAFMLFGAEIPDGMATPSGEGGGKCDHNNFDGGVIFLATCTEGGYTLYTCQTSGCGYSYKSDKTEPVGHSYVSGKCSSCGAAEPMAPTYATSLTVGQAYKLGMYSSAKGAEYYFTGTMSGYYGATDTQAASGVDVFVESASGGYYLYFKNSSGTKQYINLVLSGTYYNFTYSSSASSVYKWDEAKYALSTTVNGETCYIGTYGTYVTMGVLRSSLYQESDYIARMYLTSGSEVTPPDSSCSHNYTQSVTAPTCTKGGYTTYTCSLCSHSYTDNNTPALGHKYSGGTCTVCGATKTNEGKVTISFESTDGRTVCNDDQQIWVQNGITVTNNKSASQSDVADYYNPVRFYKGSQVTISYPKMTKIEINCDGLATKYVSGWSGVPSGATASSNGSVVTIVFDSPVDSFTYQSLTSQSRAYSFTVYSESVVCQHKNTAVLGAVEPTCEHDGHTGMTVCFDCEEVLDEGSVIRKTKHSYVVVDCTLPMTCESCGATYGEAVGHDWIDATTEAPKTCDRCGETEGEKLPSTDIPSDGPTEGDHRYCVVDGMDSFILSFRNFIRRTFGYEELCSCGEVITK